MLDRPGSIFNALLCTDVNGIPDGNQKLVGDGFPVPNLAHSRVGATISRPLAADCRPYNIG